MHASLQKSIILAFGGPAGAGKTTIAIEIIPMLRAVQQAIWLNTDAIRKELAEVPWSARLPATYYTADARDRVYEELRSRAAIAVEQRRVIIWDAGFGRPKDRRMVEQVAFSSKASFLGILFEAPLEIRCLRVRCRTANPSDADETYIRNLEQFEKLAPSEEHWRNVDAGGSEDKTLKSVLEVIQQTFPGLAGDGIVS